MEKFLKSLPPDIRKDLEAKSAAYRAALPGYVKVSARAAERRMKEAA